MIDDSEVNRIPREARLGTRGERLEFCLFIYCKLITVTNLLSRDHELFDMLEVAKSLPSYQVLSGHISGVTRYGTRHLRDMAAESDGRGRSVGGVDNVLREA